MSPVLTNLDLGPMSFNNFKPVTNTPSAGRATSRIFNTFVIGELCFIRVRQLRISTGLGYCILTNSSLHRTLVDWCFYSVSSVIFDISIMWQPSLLSCRWFLRLNRGIRFNRTAVWRVTEEPITHAEIIYLDLVWQIILTSLIDEEARRSRFRGLWRKQPALLTCYCLFLDSTSRSRASRDRRAVFD